MKVAVALSGGVDSAVCAAIMLEKGYQVVGLTMKMGHSPDLNQYCAGSQSVNDAQKVADQLGIKLYPIDVTEEFDCKVIDYMKKSYLNGLTPNPCVMCNRFIKFGVFITRALQSSIDFDYFVTGHYAKVEYDQTQQRYCLKKAENLPKDQTYFLCQLSQSQLAKLIFPLGSIQSKDKTRQLAIDYQISVHSKKESQDFISGNYLRIIDLKEKSGHILTRSGQILGRHKGIWHYTIGQRKGLGIGYQYPLYVLELDSIHNNVIVGKKEELFKRELIVKNVNWISREKIDGSLKAKTRIRYLHQESEALITAINETDVKVVFDTPQKAITCGQFAVFYQDDVVLGGGVISS